MMSDFATFNKFVRESSQRSILEALPRFQRLRRGGRRSLQDSKAQHGGFAHDVVLWIVVITQNGSFVLHTLNNRYKIITPKNTDYCNTTGVHRQIEWWICSCGFAYQANRGVLQVVVWWCWASYGCVWTCGEYGVLPNIVIQHHRMGKTSTFRWNAVVTHNWMINSHFPSFSLGAYYIFTKKNRNRQVADTTEQLLEASKSVVQWCVWCKLSCKAWQLLPDGRFRGKLRWVKMSTSNIPKNGFQIISPKCVFHQENWENTLLTLHIFTFLVIIRGTLGLFHTPGRASLWSFRASWWGLELGSWKSSTA